MNKVKIAVFASGSGSNFAALAEACEAGRIPAEIILMVTDKPNAVRVTSIRSKRMSKRS